MADEPVCCLSATERVYRKVLMKQLITVIISCCLVSCAGTSERPDSASDEGATGRNDCIREPSIRGYTVLDEQNLIVEVSRSRAYHVILYRRAYDLNRSRGIWFKSTSGRVCAGFDSVEYEGSVAGQNRIESIRELTKEEEEHLLIQYGKKEPEIKQTPVPQEIEGADVEELDRAASE